jgi:hypothetical protein
MNIELLGFRTFSIVRCSWEYKHDVSDTECFCPQVKRGEKTPTQLGPLERANLNHGTTPVRFTQLFNHSRPD